ncbi:MAG TPA: substrate-binding domain-containing protein [candidate division Zixibacteria bacterium]|nr:substrate-binding domain-containing protein [candidate division Zixibacteria bacterium]
MKKQYSSAILVCLLVAVSIISACKPLPENDQQEGALEGTITVSGAWALYPLMIRWGEEFELLHPGVRFNISAGGAGKGMADTLADAVDIGMVSREIYPAEIGKGAFGVPVAKDAVFLTVHENNPVIEDLRKKGVTRETLIGIYISGEITTWGQVVGRPDIVDPIHVFTRSDAAGAPATWAAYLGKAQEDLRGIGVYGDPGVLEAVIQDPLGMGFNNLNFAFDLLTGEPVTGAFVVPIDINENGMVGSDETIVSKEQALLAVSTGRYPSPPARDLYLVTLGKPTGLTGIFIRWALTDGQQYVGEVGYISVADKKLAEALSSME